MILDYSSISDKEIEGYYDICNGNPIAARTHFQVGIKRILRVWYEHKLEPKGVNIKRYGNKRVYNKSKISDHERKLIIKRHTMYDGSTLKAAKSLDYTRNIIREVWLREGLTIKNEKWDVYVPTLEDII